MMSAYRAGYVLGCAVDYLETGWLADGVSADEILAAADRTETMAAPMGLAGVVEPSRVDNALLAASAGRLAAERLTQEGQR